ncbi:MAG: shikimate kinase [Oscillospiraceae bacterium]|jgi:shikimate dehydrogenase|nr:shikimate kinase [Oscillospiraceae bacterium]
MMEYGLIGEKLGHSYSPMIHAHFGDYHYALREIAPGELETFLRARAFKGINITIPYKRAAMPLCARLSDAAREVGSVNTVLVQPDGTLYGHNTDMDGLIHMLGGAGIDPKGRKAAVLGSGGTSLTAQAALRRLGAREIVVVSRGGPIDYHALYMAHADVEILINATPIGMYPNGYASPAMLDRLPKLVGVADAVYNPERTMLIQDAQARGIPAVSGLAMLVAQAREAAQLFSGRAISPTEDAAICAQIRAQTLNIVLVGMPGSGKSTIGEQLAGQMNRPFVDCDTQIVRKAGASIPEIFAAQGEVGFRALESEVIHEVCRKGGQIIATGGGAVLRDANVRAMRQNARVCFLQRPLQALPRDGRPLSASDDALKALWDQRKEKYAAAADYEVVNTQTIATAVQKVQEGFYEAARH